MPPDLKMIVLWYSSMMPTLVLLWKNEQSPLFSELSRPTTNASKESRFLNYKRRPSLIKRRPSWNPSWWPTQHSSIGTIIFLDPQNIGVATGIFFLACFVWKIQRKIDFLAAAILKSNMATGAAFSNRCHRFPWPPKCRCSRWNFVPIPFSLGDMKENR